MTTTRVTPTTISPLFAGIRVALATALLSLSTFMVHAQSTSSSNSSATANAIGLAESGTGGTAYGVSDYHGSATASIGGISANPVFNQTFEGARALAPNGLGPAVLAPDVFRNLTGTLPANSTGILLALTYFDACGATLGAQDTEEVHQKGDSGHTTVTFLPHGKYFDMEKIEIQKVNLDFPNQTVETNCMGIINVTAREKNASEAQFFTVMNDAMRFVKDRLQGVEEANLLCARNSIASNAGMGNGGFAGSLSPGVSDIGSGGFFSSLLAGITGSTARTFPRTQLGLTCIVTGGQGSDAIDISYLNQGGVFDPTAVAASARRQMRKLFEEEEGKNGNGQGPKAPEVHRGPVEKSIKSAPATTQ